MSKKTNSYIKYKFSIYDINKYYKVIHINFEDYTIQIYNNNTCKVWQKPNTEFLFEFEQKFDFNITNEEIINVIKKCLKLIILI